MDAWTWHISVVVSRFRFVPGACYQACLAPARSVDKL